MSIVLGLPLRDVFAAVLGKGDIKSMLCLIVFSIVVLILAYLTNPSENSFRAYLTEQSFRHHLSKLDDNADDNNLLVDRSRSLSSPKNTSASAENGPSFHFANRASISLRTPKHIFHSFAVFTVAAMVPTSKVSERESRDTHLISHSWYIGAFGRWWRGGVFEEWYQDVIAKSKDEESWTSGILNMKRLDMLQDYKVPMFNANNLSRHLTPGSPPRLKNRDRTTSRDDSIHPRSTTPPPLPKSASLPMHTVRNGSRVYDSTRLHQQPHGQTPTNTENSISVPAPPSRSSSTLFEQSPAIAEVLRQITNAKACVAELRTQLTECQSSATQSRSVLQQEVNVHRNRKRQEDASKVELKNRTKNLEDSKRNAESSKKEADKKLRAAQTTRDDATQRMDYLGARILQLQRDLVEDGDFVSSHKSRVAAEGRVITGALEQKRLEVKGAEDHVQALNQRSRQLEDTLTSRKERLRILRQKTDLHRERRAAVFEHQQQSCHQDAWVVGRDDKRHTLTLSPVSPAQANEHPWNTSLDSAKQLSFRRRRLSEDQSPSIIQSVSFDEHTSGFNGNGFSSFTDFNGQFKDVHHKSGTTQGYFGQEFVPVGLGTAFEDDDNNMSRSFQSESDPYLDRNHRSNSYINGKVDGSPLTPSSTSTDDVQLSPFGKFAYNGSQSSPASQVSPADKTWLRSSFLSSKGLNPDAKEFNLFSSSSALNSNNNNIHNTAAPNPSLAFDALNPNGLPSTTTTTQKSLLRAFALSPAEREALQRALGGMGNKSLERLPSLSDVGSIPSSPTSNAHALPAALVAPSHAVASGSRLPAWLQSLPRSRKANFSPWDDEEPQGINSAKTS